MLDAILFDLDGTLLPMDLEEFTRSYFALLAKKVAPLGYEPEKLVRSIWQGTAAMVKNDGSVPNEKRFWDAFAAIYGEVVYDHIPVFDEFYRTDFDAAVRFTQPDPVLAQRLVAAARAHAKKVVLATNPLFPRCGVETRLRWIGLTFADFDLVTTYETSSFCKPDPRYYTEILSSLGVAPDEAIMVGNDMDEDIVAAAQAGLAASYLVTDCMINKSGSPIGGLHGTLAQAAAWLKTL